MLKHEWYCTTLYRNKYFGKESFYTLNFILYNQFEISVASFRSISIYPVLYSVLPWYTVTGLTGLLLIHPAGEDNTLRPTQGKYGSVGRYPTFTREGNLFPWRPCHIDSVAPVNYQGVYLSFSSKVV